MEWIVHKFFCFVVVAVVAAAAASYGSIPTAYVPLLNPSASTLLFLLLRLYVFLHGYHGDAYIEPGMDPPFFPRLLLSFFFMIGRDDDDDERKPPLLLVSFTIQSRN